MTVSVRTAEDDALDAIASGASDDPFAVLGPHAVVAVTQGPYLPGREGNPCFPDQVVVAKPMGAKKRVT